MLPLIIFMPFTHIHVHLQICFTAAICHIHYGILHFTTDNSIRNDSDDGRYKCVYTTQKYTHPHIHKYIHVQSRCVCVCVCGCTFHMSIKYTFTWYSRVYANTETGKLDSENGKCGRNICHIAKIMCVYVSFMSVCLSGCLAGWLSRWRTRKFQIELNEATATELWNEKYNSSKCRQKLYFFNKIKY